MTDSLTKHGDFNPDAVFELDLINHKQGIWTPKEGRDMIILVMGVLALGNGAHSNYHRNRRFIYKTLMQENSKQKTKN